MSCHQYGIRPRDEEPADEWLTRPETIVVRADPVMDWRKAPYMKYVNTYCEGI